ncbi:hypothetical protein [Eikenella corrodens]|nr:hypothetical protein [Eikenella corrodens]
MLKPIKWLKILLAGHPATRSGFVALCRLPENEKSSLHVGKT